MNQKQALKPLNQNHIVGVLALLPIVLMINGVVLAFMTYENLSGFLGDFSKILVSRTLLLTDFMVIGGVAVALVQAALMGFLMLLVMRFFKVNLTGLAIAAFFTVVGFALFGKNLFNVIPIFVGGYLYSRYQKIQFKNVLSVIMFGTALAPVVSEVVFSGLFPESLSLPFGIVIGVFLGYIITPLSSHMLRFHDGYNLYNIGFTAGIAGLFVASVFKALKVNVTPTKMVYQTNLWYLWVSFMLLFAIYVLIGLIYYPKEGKGYLKLLSHKGRAITDFTLLEGYGLSILNMGIMGLLCMVVIALMQGVLNGPVLGGVLTVVGFATFGKHPKNTLPIMIGVVIGALLFHGDLSRTPVVIAVLFSTTIAPIAGAFGLKLGVVAGILHFVFVSNVGDIHAGMNLYNNGFAGGFVAACMLPVLDAFKKGERLK